MFARVLGISKCLWGHIGCTHVLDKAINVGCGGHFSREAARRACLAIPNLPIEDLHMRPLARWIGHEDTARTEGPVDDLFVVGETDHFGNLPQQIETHLDTQLVLVLHQEMIEPDGQRIVLKDQRRAEHMLCETLTTENSLMLECFEELGFTLRRPLDCPALLVSRSGAHCVNTHAAFDIGEPGMRGLPVLVPRTFADYLV